MPKILFIRAEWDDEADVWVATSDDVPGLATEAETIEALSSKLQTMVPELLDAGIKGARLDLIYQLAEVQNQVQHYLIHSRTGVIAHGKSVQPFKFGRSCLHHAAVA
jgi:predicted RNase H-like HicB family nuclease